MSRQIPEMFPTKGLQVAFLQEDFNGFGFQVCESRPGFLCIARVPDTFSVDLDTKIRDDVGSKTLTMINMFGNYFLLIKFTEWSLIPQVFNAACRYGCEWIIANTCHLLPRARFTGKPFSFEEAERLTISEFHDFRNQFRDKPASWRTVFNLLGAPQAMLKLYNYRTTMGKNFCAELCRNLGTPLDDTSEEAYSALPPWYDMPGVDSACEEAGVLRHAEWSKRERPQPVAPKRPLTPEGGEDSPKRQKHGSEDVLDCLICCESIANTMVLPCGHIVVCRACSKRLGESQYANQCILCRQLIEEVLMDEPAVAEVVVIDKE